MSPEPIPNPKDFEPAPMIDRRAATTPDITPMSESNPSVDPKQFPRHGLTPDERGMRTRPDGGWFGGEETLPPRFGGCTCSCHTTPGVKHMKACCWPPEISGTPGGIAQQPDLVNHPPHYKAHPSGVECITVTRHMNFNLGNVVKYIWRADNKGAPLQDLEKAAWYLNDEIERRRAEGA